MRAAASVLLLAIVATMMAADLASSRDKAGSKGSKPKQAIFLVNATVKRSILFLRRAPENCCCPADSAGEWGGRPRIMLVLANKGARALWLAARLTPPSSYLACELRSSVGPKQKTDFLFTQDSLFAGDYSLNIMAFADSAFADTVESTSWSFRPR